MEETTAYAKGIVEAILFVSEKPVTLEQLRQLMEGFDNQEIKRAVRELQQDCEDQRRGMTIVEIAGGFQMLSSPHYISYVRNFFKTRVKEKLSRPALETLAIIAYKQPVSRADIEMIRGVNSDGVVNHLLNKSLIKVVGRKDVPGRPFIYGTAKEFLEYFGLKSLKDMPKLDDLADELTQAALEEAKIEAGVLPVAEDAATAPSDTDSEETGDRKTEPDTDGKELPSPIEAVAEDAAESPLDLKQAMDEISHQEEQAAAVDPAVERRLPDEVVGVEDATTEPQDASDIGKTEAAIVADEEDVMSKEEPQS